MALEGRHASGPEFRFGVVFVGQNRGGFQCLMGGVADRCAVQLRPFSERGCVGELQFGKVDNCGLHVPVLGDGQRMGKGFGALNERAGTVDGVDNEDGFI